MISVRNARKPYLVRFVSGSYQRESHQKFPVPVYLLRAENLTPHQKDFFIQCYDYLRLGVRVPPPASTKTYFSQLKIASMLGSESGGGSECTTNGPVLDLMFLPGHHAYLGWFTAHEKEGGSQCSATLSQDVSNAWESGKMNCMSCRYNYYEMAVRRQYSYQLTTVRNASPSHLSLDQILRVHEQHFNFLRTFDSCHKLIKVFCKIMSRDSLDPSMLSTDCFPTSLRTLEILTRYALRTAHSDSPSADLLKAIEQSCKELKVPWWMPAVERLLTPSSQCIPKGIPSLCLPGIHCPLFEFAADFALNEGGRSNSWSAVLNRLLQQLTDRFDAREQRIFSQLNVPREQARGTHGEVSQAQATPSGLLDEEALQDALHGGKHHEKHGMGQRASGIGASLFDGWTASMGLDSNGYISYTLRGCDMLISYLGGSLSSRSHLLEKLEHLRHQLLVHQLRRYGVGSTDVWKQRESAAQCFPFFESNSLSLQVKATICILNFSYGGHNCHTVSCPLPLRLLSVLYPRLTPCLLLGGTAEGLLMAKESQHVEARVAQLLTTVSISLNSSQFEDLKRRVRAQVRHDTSGVAAVGVVFQDGRWMAFFNPNESIPFHHIS